MEIINDLKLKPCPFCNHEAQILHHPEWSWASYEVECSECGATFDYAFYTPEEAANQWNKRNEVL